MGRIFKSDAYAEFSETFGRLLTSPIELRALFERLSAAAAAAFGTDQAFIFAYHPGGRHRHVSAGTSGHARLPLQDAAQLDAAAQSDHRTFIITDNLAPASDLYRMLRSHRIGAVMPLRRHGDVIGYLLLGNRRGGYTQRLLRPLAAFGDQLVVTVSGAVSLHEVKALNATLQQRIDVATAELRSSNAQLKHLDEVKDEFMSMASHQLRTPLTSVKGYLSMVLEGDAGDITPQQRKLLVEAFNSSERMVRLIADFLNVSRLQTGKFIIDKQATDLVRIVRQETASLQLIAESREVTLKLTAPRGHLVAHADEAKIREVIMNFIDNAIFYSRPGGIITVTLERDGSDALFAVTDQGIGVPQDQQARLFNRFFRATNARKQRPDGTGVGLYLARKVVTAHGGSVLFHSVEGQGSTFGFRLPAAAITKSD